MSSCRGTPRGLRPCPPRQVRWLLQAGERPWMAVLRPRSARETAPVWRASAPRARRARPGDAGTAAAAETRTRWSAREFARREEPRTSRCPLDGGRGELCGVACRHFWKAPRVQHRPISRLPLLRSRQAAFQLRHVIVHSNHPCWAAPIESTKSRAPAEDVSYKTRAAERVSSPCRARHRRRRATTAPRPPHEVIREPGGDDSFIAAWSSQTISPEEERHCYRALQLGPQGPSASARRRRSTPTRWAMGRGGRAGGGRRSTSARPLPCRVSVPPFHDAASSASRREGELGPGSGAITPARVSPWVAGSFALPRDVRS